MSGLYQQGGTLPIRIDRGPQIRTAGRQTFSLDFDDTFTADPELWSFFVAKAQVLGHRVVCVTARFKTEGNLQELKRALPGGVEILFCGPTPKRKHATNNAIEIDVWIDDYPEAIVTGDDRLEAAYEEVQRMQLLVVECREQRDNAKNRAMEDLQKEMGSLRAEITRLKAQASK